MRVIAIAMLVCLHSHAQVASFDRPDSLANAFVNAVSRKSMDLRADLLHPKSRACITSESNDYSRGFSSGN